MGVPKRKHTYTQQQGESKLSDFAKEAGGQFLKKYRELRKPLSSIEEGIEDQQEHLQKLQHSLARISIGKPKTWKEATILEEKILELQFVYDALHKQQEAITRATKFKTLIKAIRDLPKKPNWKDACCTIHKVLELIAVYEGATDQEKKEMKEEVEAVVKHVKRPGFKKCLKLNRKEQSLKKKLLKNQGVNAFEEQVITPRDEEIALIESVLMKEIGLLCFEEDKKSYQTIEKELNQLLSGISHTLKVWDGLFERNPELKNFIEHVFYNRPHFEKFKISEPDFKFTKETMKEVDQDVKNFRVSSEEKEPFQLKTGLIKRTNNRKVIKAANSIENIGKRYLKFDKYLNKKIAELSQGTLDEKSLGQKVNALELLIDEERQNLASLEMMLEASEETRFKTKLKDKIQFLKHSIEGLLQKREVLKSLARSDFAKAARYKNEIDQLLTQTLGREQVAGWKLFQAQRVLDDLVAFKNACRDPFVKAKIQHLCALSKNKIEMVIEQTEWNLTPKNRDVKEHLLAGEVPQKSVFKRVGTILSLAIAKALIKKDLHSMDEASKIIHLLDEAEITCQLNQECSEMTTAFQHAQNVA